jgi:hypothetical protein
VTSLNLGLYQLGRRTAEEFISILSAIPASVTSLNFSMNCLGEKNAAELVSILSAIPASVTSLILNLNALHNKTIKELEQISKCLPYVLRINCLELDQDQFTALNRYNGHAIKAIYQELEKRFPSVISQHIFSYWVSPNPRDLIALLDKEAPPQEISRYNKFNVGLSVILVSAILEAIVLLSLGISIQSTLMCVAVLGGPIALGLLAGLCFEFCFESNKSMHTLA